MEEKRTLLVGMDIGEQVTQISCFDFTTYEPVAIGRMIHGKREYDIDLCTRQRGMVLDR